MPTYDFRCNVCSHEFEAFQSMKDKPLTKCPKCGKKALERLIGTGAAIVFKGSGFYQTDYRSESYKKAAEADKPAAPAAESKTEASGDKTEKKDAAGKDAKPAETKAGDAKAGEGKKAEPAAAKAAPISSKISVPVAKDSSAKAGAGKTGRGKK